MFKDPEPLEHAVLVHADPAGQHAAAVGTLSQSDCYPDGPAGPYVAGGPVGPDDCLQVLEPFEQLVLDHADPAGQHAVILNTVESLEHVVVENILDGRPMEGITCPELLEHLLRLLDTTLDGGLVEKISDWVPEASPVPDTTPDGRLMEGTTYLEHSALGVSLDSGLMAGMSSLEPLEQSVLNTLLVAQPGEEITEKTSDWEPVAHPVPDTTLDGRLTEGTTYLEHSALGVSLDSGLMAGMSSLEPLEQSVLNTLLAARPVQVITETDSESASQSRPLLDVALDCRTMEGISVPLLIESSGLVLAPDSGNEEHLPSSGPLEHSVLNVIRRHDNLNSSKEPQFGSDPGQSSPELEDAIRSEVLRSRLMGCVSACDVTSRLLSPEYAILSDKEMSLDEVCSEGLWQWTMDMDVEYQYEIFNGLSVHLRWRYV